MLIVYEWEQLEESLEKFSNPCDGDWQWERGEQKSDCCHKLAELSRLDCDSCWLRNQAGSACGCVCPWKWQSLYCPAQIGHKNVTCDLAGDDCEKSNEFKQLQQLHFPSLSPTVPCIIYAKLTVSENDAIKWKENNNKRKSYALKSMLTVWKQVSGVLAV